MKILKNCGEFFRLNSGIPFYYGLGNNMLYMKVEYPESNDKYCSYNAVQLRDGKMVHIPPDALVEPAAVYLKCESA